jgi:hypothetical protein
MLRESCRISPLFPQHETMLRRSRFLSRSYTVLSGGIQMSLRDIYSNNEPGNISLHTEPQGNGAGLDNFHTINPEDREPNNTGKIVGALAVALMVGAAGIGLYATLGSSTTTKPMVSASNAPALPPPSAAPAAAPQQDAMTTPADANTPASTSSTDAAPAPAPMKSADAAPVTTKTADAAPVKSSKTSKTAKADTSTDNMASQLNGDKSQTVVPKQSAAAEPVSPTPSPNDVASNSAQSSVAVQPNATSASDIPAPQPQQQANTATPVAPEQAQPTVQAPAEASPAPAAQTPAAQAPATEAAPAAQPAPAPAQ